MRHSPPPLRKILMMGLAMLLFWPLTGGAQQVGAQNPFRLLADKMEIIDGNTLVATGQVDIYSNTMRLTASQVIYDRSTGQISVKGPLLFDDGQSTVILASSAQLSEDLRQGLIRTAKMIIDQELQMTAAVMQRVEGRYTVMRRAKASSCQTCAGGPPLWEIRASRVVHDTQKQQIYFSDAQFRMAGLPLAYFPRLRLPDSTLQRGTGFLVPKLEVTSTWGIGLKTPYFVAIGPHKDLTLTPYYADTGAKSLDLRYRQAFATGNVTVNAQLAQDTPTSDVRRYYKAAGSFSLPRKYTLTFSGETISGSGYFAGYGLNEKDRFVTSLAVGRASRDQIINARLLGFYSVRATDDNTTQPSQFADVERLDRVDLGTFGELRLGVQANIRLRASTSAVDGSDADSAADGRDVRGFGLRASWHKGVVLPMGLLADATLALRSDDYTVVEDATFGGRYDRRHAALGVQLRWPWIKAAAQGKGGGVHVIEPMAQLVLAPKQTERLFNDDSALVEFDEGNLFAINRFPGSDRVETASRANLGVNYTYTGARDMRIKLALGRVISAQNTAQFARASGLGQQRSDWLVAGQLSMNNALSITARSLWTEAGAVRKMELRSAIKSARTDIALGYLYAPADTDEERSETVSEITLAAAQKVSQRWNGSITARYDAASSKLSQSGLALVYRNECLQMDLSLSRSFATSTTVTANQTIGFSVALVGFGGQSAGVAQQCRG